jgi:DNA-binding NtrC family response regulator
MRSEGKLHAGHKHARDEQAIEPPAEARKRGPARRLPARALRGCLVAVDGEDEKTGGNKRQAAKLLQLSRTTLIDKLQRLNVRTDFAA